MLVGFIGDSHGQWESLYNAVALLQNKGVEKIIQVGDFGYWDDSLSNLRLDTPIYFIDGNHEQFPLLLENVDNKKKAPQEIQSNLWYIPRGTILNWESTHFGFLGGAFSVDFKNRKDGYSWFSKEEAPTEEEASLIKQADVLVTHDVFAEVTFYNPFRLNKNCELDRRSREVLQGVFERTLPKAWVHGHYHTAYTLKLRNCDVVGLGIAPDIAIYDTEKKEFVNRLVLDFLK
jgi:predicted phosphodiesterase